MGIYLKGMKVEIKTYSALPPSFYLSGLSSFKKKKTLKTEQRLSTEE